MNDVILINEKQLSVKEFNGIRVVSAQDIAKLHNKEAREVGYIFDRNRERFIEGEDYFAITRDKAKSILNAFEDLFTSPRQLEAFLFTESGYLMLVKSFTDDLSWTIQRKLVNAYFRGNESSVKILSTTEALLQAVQILDQQSKQLKAIEMAQAEHKQKIEVINHRVDSLDAVNVGGDLRQRLNRMVQKLARQRGIMFNVAWHEFKTAYNLAYRTNLELLILNYEKKTGLKKVTVPQYLSAVGKLEDGVRVADKLLNAA